MKIVPISYRSAIYVMLLDEIIIIIIIYSPRSHASNTKTIYHTHQKLEKEYEKEYHEIQRTIISESKHKKYDIY